MTGVAFILQIVLLCVFMGMYLIPAIVRRCRWYHRVLLVAALVALIASVLGLVERYVHA